MSFSFRQDDTFSVSTARPAELETTVPHLSSECAFSSRSNLDYLEESHSPPINALVVQKTGFPTPKAAIIADEALHTAKIYYRLFFDVAQRKSSGRQRMLDAEPVEAEGSVESPMGSAEGLAIGNEVSSGGAPNPDQAVKTSVTPSSTAAVDQTDEPSECSSLMEVPDTPYHTFFPPKLNRRQREVIVRRIIGRPARPFSQLVWRKIETHSCPFEGGATAYERVSMTIPKLDATTNMNTTAGGGGVSGTTMEGGSRQSAWLTPPRGWVALGRPKGLSHPPFPANGPPKRLFPRCGGVLSEGRAGGGAGPQALTGWEHVGDSSSPPTAPPTPSTVMGRCGMMPDQSTYTIPASQQGPEYFLHARESGGKTLIVVMVGLPARGKTFLAQKICRLLGWQGTKAKVLNVQVAWSYVMTQWQDAPSGSEPASSPPPPAPPSLPSSSPSLQLNHEGNRPHSSQVLSSTEDVSGSFRSRAVSDGALETTSRRSERGVHGPTDSTSLFQFSPPSFHHSVCDPHLQNAANYIDDSYYMETFEIGHDNGAAGLFNAEKGAQVLLEKVEVGSNCEEKERGEEGKTDSVAESAPCQGPSHCCGGDARGSYLSAENFRALLCDPESSERALYRYVLSCFVEDCRGFFSQGGQVVLINDDFVTEEMRQEVERLFKPLSEQYMYMEVLRDEGVSRRFNVCKVRDPKEYPKEFISRKAAKRDFEKRSRLLERLYEPLEEAAPQLGDAQTTPSSRCYVKVRNSNAIESHGLSGYLASRIIFFVMNLSQTKMQHPIYFIRHGQSCYNLENRVGGNPLLTDQGMRDASAFLEFLVSLRSHLRQIDAMQRGYRLRKNRFRARKSHKGKTRVKVPKESAPFAEERMDNSVGSNGASSEDSVVSAALGSPHERLRLGRAHTLELWTSQLQRAIQTAEFGERLLNIRTLRWSRLNEIHAGVCEGMTYDEVLEKYPLIDMFRRKSKYTFRYPDGESYQDLVARLEPIILELENTDRVVVVVAHQAVLRCLLAYFGSTSAQSSVCVPVPHRTVWRCTYDSKGIASLEELSLEDSPAGLPAGWRHFPNSVETKEDTGDV